MKGHSRIRGTKIQLHTYSLDYLKGVTQFNGESKFFSIDVVGTEFSLWKNENIEPYLIVYTQN